MKKSIFQILFDFGFPIGLFFIYFQFYNFGKITPQEMIKTTGLVAIALLSITLAIGPLSRFLPFLNNLKIYRKIWGILSFVFAFIHMSLIFAVFFKFNLAKFVDFSNPKYPGLLAGILALLILLIITLSSTKAAFTSLPPKVWKFIQSTVYLALFFAVLHFYLVESVNGVLVIKRLLGQITFGFTGFVALLRLVTLLLPSQKSS